MDPVQKKLQREDNILSSLKKLDYATRRQLQRLHDLSGDRNALRILQNLKPYVSSFPSATGENVYHLNKAGRDRAGCTVVRSKTNQAGHYLMRNDAYIHYAGHEDWRNEMRFHVKEVNLTLVSDAYFRYQGMRHFLECDHLQHMYKNREKAERYQKLYATGVLQEKIKYFPRLVWVTLTEARKKQLLDCCQGLDAVVHVWDEIK